MELIRDPAVENVFDNYPRVPRGKMLRLRKLILDVAEKTKGVEQLEETLKWGEPSYLTKKGSTIRMDWKVKQPNQYAIYFKCTSQLVPVFREIYGDIFNYEGNRAIVFGLKDRIPVKEVKQCIKMALTYHQVKHLPLLGLGAGA